MELFDLKKVETLKTVEMDSMTWVILNNTRMNEKSVEWSWQRETEPDRILGSCTQIDTDAEQFSYQTRAPVTSFCTSEACWQNH
jgi:hypothetical protein